MDWKQGFHKLWCGKAGEKSVDYEIKPSEGKGLGLFVKRDFERGEKILVERSVMTREANGSHNKKKLDKYPAIKTAVMALAPHGGNLMTKFTINCAAQAGDEDPSNDGSSGLFVNFSRINHDCIGNVCHFFESKHNLMVVVANHQISAGSEVTFSYASHVRSRERAMRLSFRGFQCSCRACTNPEIADKLDRMKDLDEKIGIYGSDASKHSQAIRSGLALIKLYDEFHSSDLQYHRTYHDLFQICITRRRNVKEGIKYIKKAREHALRFHQFESNDVVRKYDVLCKNPSSHRNYALLG